MSQMRRRDFLRASLCATAASGAFGALWPKLLLAGGPLVLNGSSSDYRALVCVYLAGGNDSFSSIVPINGAHRTAYDASRRGSGQAGNGGQSNPSDLRIASDQLLTLSGISQDGSAYGLHPQMSGLRALVNGGRAAIVANVGPLVRPTSFSDYDNDLVPLPAQLFSHSDQTVLWQTPRADTGQRIGWGGRLADRFQASNGNPLLSMNMSISGENVFQAGQNVLPYFLNQQGAEVIDRIDTSDGQSWNQRRRDSFTAMMSASYAHPLERAYASKVRVAREAGDQLASALRQDRTVNGEGVETGYADDAYAPFWQAFGLSWQRADQGRAVLPGLAAQLLMVARVIRQRGTLQMSRQLFYTELGGFDTHDSQNADLPELLRELSQSMLAFDQVMSSGAFGLGDQVTAFTASEFGRTLSNNGDGTDHGWGGHHFVVGGSVRGGQVFGELPPLGLQNNPLNLGQGRIIPTLAVDQYAATLASWFGLAASDRAEVFPNLAQMVGSKLSIEGPDLGFLRPL